MDNFLRFLRKSFNIGLIVLFVATLMLAIPMSTVTANVTNENTLKNWLSDSNFYNNFYEQSIYLFEFQDDNDEVKTLAAQIEETGLFTVDEVRETIRQAIPPEFLQRNIEDFIGAFYNFLQSDADLMFTFSLEERSDDVAREFKELFGNKLASLPVCGPEDAQRLKEDDGFNPLTADCRPPGGNVQSEVNKFIDELVSGDGPINSNFTQDDLDLSEEDTTNFRNLYDFANSSGLAFLVLLLILFGLVVATSRPWYKSLLPLGIASVVVGMLMFGSFMLASSQAKSINLESSEFSERQQEAVNELFNPLISTASDDIAAEGILFSLLTVSAGAAMIVLEHVMKKRHKQDKPKTMLDDDYDEKGDNSKKQASKSEDSNNKSDEQDKSAGEKTETKESESKDKSEPESKPNSKAKSESKSKPKTTAKKSSS